MSQNEDQGEELFRIRCKMCHSLTMRLVGPAIEGVNDRHDKEWLYSFINGSQAMIQLGDQKAVELFNEYNQVIMPDQELSTDQIDAILSYVKAAEAIQVISGPGLGDSDSIPSRAPLSPGHLYTMWSVLLLGILAVLIGVFCLKELMNSLENRNRALVNQNENK